MEKKYKIKVTVKYEKVITLKEILEEIKDIDDRNSLNFSDPLTDKDLIKIEELLKEDFIKKVIKGCDETEEASLESLVLEKIE